MRASELYDRLKADFIKDGITDYNWAARMPALDEYLTDEFRRSGMGLMCDFAGEIGKVYTTVFLSDEVLKKILADDIENAMIFSHHPTNWDIERHGGNYAATKSLIEELRERRISIYVLHHPLDNFGDYATCKTLADSLSMTIERPAFLYCGALCGVIGRVDCATVGELSERYSKAVGHKTSLYRYGEESIAGKRIALCPGGGNDKFVIEEMMSNGITTLVTGVTIANDYSKAIHEMEKENGINLLGGTHYSTEKFAPMKMCEYFSKLGLAAEFIEDEPNLYDL